MSGEEQEAQIVLATGHETTPKYKAAPTVVNFCGVTIPRRLEANPSLRFGMTMRSSVASYFFVAVNSLVTFPSASRN
jgi:hypothetical protein